VRIEIRGPKRFATDELLGIAREMLGQVTITISKIGNGQHE